jgi:hypothetical protein
MIKNIEIGEIIKIRGREYIVKETLGSNGIVTWHEPSLILLNKAITGIYKNPYLTNKLKRENQNEKN